MRSVTMARADDPILPLVANLVCSYIAHNDTSSRQLPGLIRDVWSAMTEHTAIESISPVPAIRSARLTSDDGVTCLECGTQMKMLKRHLQTTHNITPAQYRTKWRLPGNYPMVAKKYAALRS